MRRRDPNVIKTVTGESHPAGTEILAPGNAAEPARGMILRKQDWTFCAAMKPQRLSSMQPRTDKMGSGKWAIETRSSKNEERFLDTALTEMFRRVGRKYSPQATAKPKWYDESTWTSREQAGFRRWLTQLFRLEFKHQVSLAKMAAGGFVLNYGWKVDDQQSMRA